MLSSAEIIRQSGQRLQSRDHTIAQATRRRDNNFPQHERADQTAVNTTVITFFTSFAAILWSVSQFAPHPQGATEALIIAAGGIGPFIIAALAWLVTFKTLSRIDIPRRRRYIEATAVDTTVEIRTTISEERLITALHSSWMVLPLEEITLNFEKEESLKIVAETRVRNEYCEGVINGWIDGSVNQLPGVDDDATVQRKQLAHDHQAMAHQLLQTLPTTNNKTISSGVSS